MNKPFVQPAVERRPAVRHPAPPLWLLALLTLSGTLGMHIFAPTLSRVAHDLNASVSAVELTISLYILGLGFGQLIYGPLSDRFGRRPALMGGLVLYAAAGAAAALAPGVRTLVAARLLQALGGCAGLAIARAMVRDTAPPIDTARRLALLNMMITLGPGVAPILGAALAQSAGWRSILWLLSALGVALLLFAWRRLPETAPPSAGAGGAEVIKNYGRLLKSPVFLGFTIGGSCATTSVYAFIGSSPFILVDQLHRPTSEVGFCLAIVIAGIWLGGALANRLVSRTPMYRLLIGANLFSLVAAAALLAAVLSGRLSVVLLIAPIFLFTVGAGTASPVALSEAVSVNPQAIGAAAGFYGFTQMAVGAICTSAAGLAANPALGVALVIFIVSLIAQTSFWLAVSWRAPPPLKPG